MKAFTSYRDYSAEYDTDTHVLTVRLAQAGFFTVKADEARYDGRKAFDLSDYESSSIRVEKGFDRQTLRVEYQGGPEEQESFAIVVTLSSSGVDYRMDVMGHYDVWLNGDMKYANSPRPVCLDRRGMDLRCGFGPAASKVDNALFDEASDSALEVIGPGFRMKYDWERRLFVHSMHTGGDDIVRGFSLRVKRRVYETRFGVAYAPVNRNNRFPRPPVGWMTWYAVQFDACEKTVLENARFLKEKLAAYGANAIWVDWEWYHRDFSGTHDPGVDVFHPDPERYPNGLAAVANEIKAMGLIPALWIGATNDPTRNEFIQANPDALLVQKRGWCGQYFLDPTHPKVLSQYIPRVFSQIREMGYEAAKWDCLPITFERVDSNHDKLYNPALSTDEAMRAVVAAARDVVGPDFYMLSCSGDTLRDMLFAGDLFDAARIGGDIFRWSEFISQGVNRILAMYPFHNTLLYADPDNVVIRPKYNTFDQAVSRVSIVSVLGLPFTIGDNLPDLEDERLSLIRRAIPIMDIHPMDIRENIGDNRQLVVNLAIATPYEEWNVVDVLNLLETRNTLYISLDGNLHLDTGAGERYLLFDYWNGEYMGEVGEGFRLTLDPCASRVICVRRKTGIPQIISTTRHISQGALELSDVSYDRERRVLSGTADVVPGDDYAIYVYAPAGLRLYYEGNDSCVFDVERVDLRENLEFEAQCPEGSVWKIPLGSEAGGKTPWSVAFIPCHPA
ncbi:MAG: alpha-galactosidase [Clostridia bacterium]|nr:alpha-galactosidase [Clostridia bacterium]